MKIRSIPVWLFLISLIIPASCTYQETLELSTPESVGMSSGRIGQINNLLLSIVDNNTAKGAVAAVARHGNLVYMNAVGEMDEGRPMQENTIFRIV